jgi:chromosome segregation ATPase
MTDITLDIENIGGIDELTVAFEEGVTLVQGPNATNKTSLLESVLFALGGSTVLIKSDADEARVKLTIGDRTVERTAHRTDQGIRTDGEAWVEDEDERLMVERFAALLGTNPLRTAVSQEQPVEPLLKEPMNIDALEAERAQKMQVKRQLESRLDELDDVDARLAEHEEQLAEKRERESDLETRLEELEQQREAAADGEDEELAALRERRVDLRSEQADCQAQADRLEDAVDRLESQLADVETEIADAEAAVEDADVEALNQERAEIRSELEDVEARLDILQSVLTANREMLDSDFTGILGYEAGLTGDQFTCWACGQSAENGDFEATVEDLQRLIEQDKGQLRDREPELDELDERIRSARQARSRRQELAAKRRDLNQQLEERRDSLDQQRSRLEEFRGELQSIDDEIAEKEARETDNDEVAAELESTRADLQSVRRELGRLERTCEGLREEQRERDEKADRVEELEADIAGLTDRIENLEDELRENFNAAMDDLLAALDFERIERIWLDGNFELVIAREVDGSVRADMIKHLAESEREMIGLVLGLAGYVTYDVSEVSPVLALDSLGAFDSERTERLVDYFADRTDVLLAAVHPATTGADGYERVTFERPAAD